MKKSVKYLEGKSISLDIDIKFASLFENFLLYYISNANSPEDTLKAYKKIEQVINKSTNVKLDEYETYLYCLTALCQNIRKTALEQKAAVEFDIPDAVAEKSKHVASMILKNQGDNAEEINDLYKDLLNDFNSLS